MISIDMVGWYEASNKVEYIGSGTIQNGNEIILNSQIIPAELNVVTKKFETNIFTATDTQPFAIKRIPTLHVTTGTKSPFHTSRDDAHLIDFDGMTLIVEHLNSLIESISQDDDFEPSGRLARKHKPQQLVEFGVSAYFGSAYHRYTAVQNGENNSGNLFGAGLLSQINFGIFAIRPELYYDHIRIFHSAGVIATNNITVPLSLVLQTPEHWFTRGDIFFGGYYSYSFNGKHGRETTDFENIYNRGEVGITFGFSQILNPFKIGIAFRTSLTDFTQSTVVNNGHIRNSALYTTITYTF